MWFFPTLISLMPLVSRVGMSLLAPEPEQRRLAKSDEEVCIELHNECVEACGPQGSTHYDDCVAICYEEFEQCIEEGPDTYKGPTCDLENGYCGYGDHEDYDYESHSNSTWACDSSDNEDSDYYEYPDDSSNDSSDDSSSDDGGWGCGSDSYDEGDSGEDGDEGEDGDDGDGGDWGEDWGERSPAGGDGIDSPLDLPH